MVIRSFLNKLPGTISPLISGHVGAAVAALYPAINAPNINCTTKTTMMAILKLFDEGLTTFLSFLILNCSANQ